MNLVSLWGACLLAAAMPAFVACSSDYAGSGSYPTRSTGTAPSVGSETPAPGATSATDAGSAGSTHWDAGSGTHPWPDAGAAAGDAGGTTSGAFLGETTPYASAPVSVSARDRHQSLGQIQQQPDTNCLGCHGASGTAPAFVAAGFVATQAGGTNGASDVEVRVWSTTQAAGASAHTDADGFFWISAAGASVAAPFKAGARDATHTVVMPTQPPGGACNGASCHGGGQGAIHL